MSVCVLGGSGSQLVITHLAFSGLIVGDDHVVLITCSITANVNKGLHWRPVTLPVWVLREGGMMMMVVEVEGCREQILF